MAIRIGGEPDPADPTPHPRLSARVVLCGCVRQALLTDGAEDGPTDQASARGLAPQCPVEFLAAYSQPRRVMHAGIVQQYRYRSAEASYLHHWRCPQVWDDVLVELPSMPS